MDFACRALEQRGSEARAHKPARHLTAEEPELGYFEGNLAVKKEVTGAMAIITWLRRLSVLCLLLTVAFGAVLIDKRFTGTPASCAWLVPGRKG